MGAIRYSMVKKLLHTRYRVKDLEKTVSFYKDVLGLKELRRQTSGRGSQLVFLKAPEGDEEIEICKFDEAGPVVVGPDLRISLLKWMTWKTLHGKRQRKVIHCRMGRIQIGRAHV